MKVKFCFETQQLSNTAMHFVDSAFNRVKRDGKIPTKLDLLSSNVQSEPLFASLEGSWGEKGQRSRR